MIITCQTCEHQHSIAPNQAATAIVCQHNGCGTEIAITVEMLRAEVIRCARELRRAKDGGYVGLAVDLFEAVEGLEQLDDTIDGPNGYGADGELVDPDALCTCGVLLDWHPIGGCELNGGLGVWATKGGA